MIKIIFVKFNWRKTFLVIKDGRVKPKLTEEKAKIPKLKCSLLQEYAKSRVTVEDEVDEDLLVPEKRLNLLMASPSITRRRSSLMPSSSTNGWSWQNNINLPSAESDKNDTSTDNDDEDRNAKGDYRNYVDSKLHLAVYSGCYVIIKLLAE